jgi:hypothetical protein
LNTERVNQPILIAIPDDWRIEIRRHLAKEGVATLEASSYDDAFRLVLSRPPQGIIIILDWLITDNVRSTELLNIIKNKIPTVILVRTPNDYSWLKDVYIPQFHEYCTIPVAVDELIFFMERTGMIKQ